MLTIPVSVALAKEIFSKLKLIKSYLRSTMSQQRSKFKLINFIVYWKRYFKLN